MKSLKIILSILTGLTVIYLLLCSMGVKSVDIMRSTTINAPVSIIYANVIDMSKWEEWGNWHKQDPNMQISYSDNTIGLGAKNSWKSEKLGNGSQEIIEVLANKLIKTKLQFEGWEGYSYADIIFKKVDGNKTKIDWTLKGDSDIPFLMRGMLKLMNFEGAIIKDYDDGLLNLKKLSEKMAAERPLTYNGYEVKRINFPAKTLIAVRKTIPVDQIQAFYLKHLSELHKKTTVAKAEITGQPFGIFYDYNEQTGQTDIAAAIPVKEDINIGKDYETITLNEQKALLINYYGNYHETGKAHEAMEQYIKMNGLSGKMLAMEEYVTDPSKEKDASKWLTKIYYLMENT